MFRRDNGRKQWGITLKKKGQMQRETVLFLFLSWVVIQRRGERMGLSLSLSSCQKWADDGHKKNPLQMEMKKIIEGRKQKKEKSLGQITRRPSSFFFFFFWRGPSRQVGLLQLHPQTF